MLYTYILHTTSMPTHTFRCTHHKQMICAPEGWCTPLSPNRYPESHHDQHLFSTDQKPIWVNYNISLT